MYKPPYTIQEIKNKFSQEVMEELLNDPIHVWRAETGIELIHKEPTKEEQERIWQNWNEMDDEQKNISNKKSLELFGKNNIEHNQDLMGE